MIEAVWRYRLLPGCLMLLTGLVAGCMDDPSLVGSKLVPPGDLLQVDSLRTVAIASHSQKNPPLSFSSVPTTFAVGKSDNFEAWGLFSLVGLPDTLKGIVLEGAELHLKASYHLGDSLAPLSFNIHQALVNWNGATFTYDSLMAPGIFDPTSTPVTLGSFGDTDEVIVPLDTALVMSWFRAAYDTTIHNHGIVLEPTNTSVIRGFAASTTDADGNAFPRVTARYIDAGTGLPDTLQFSLIVDRFLAGMPDTSALSDSTLLLARGGAAYRSAIDFNISPVPSHALIHRAYLEVHVDSVTSRFASAHSGRLYALFPATLHPVQTSETFTDSGQWFFRFNVTEFVQSMVLGSGTHEIFVSTFEEENNVELYSIFGSAAANPAVRPRLTVLYSRTR